MPAAACCCLLLLSNFPTPYPTALSPLRSVSEFGHISLCLYFNLSKIVMSGVQQ
jgi:hypothetical protein